MVTVETKFFCLTSGKYFCIIFLCLMFSLEMNGQAALSLGSIVNRLLFVFPCSAFKALHIDTLRLFMNAMTDLTCSFLQAVAKEEEVSSSSGSRMD